MRVIGEPCAEKRIFDFGAEMVQKWCNSNEAQPLVICGVWGDGEAIEPTGAWGGRRLVRWALPPSLGSCGATGRAGERDLATGEPGEDIGFMRGTGSVGMGIGD